mmetsp:Transcript_39700/g.126850  ORF Transcript_39700/g.126850 Transcript_39700/m.126850 type:complete len:202 (+) Transcript_39700:189-794(+)
MPSGRRWWRSRFSSRGWWRSTCRLCRGWGAGSYTTGRGTSSASTGRAAGAAQSPGRYSRCPRSSWTPWPRAPWTHTRGAGTPIGTWPGAEDCPEGGAGRMRPTSTWPHTEDCPNGGARRMRPTSIWPHTEDCPNGGARRMRPTSTWPHTEDRPKGGARRRRPTSVAAHRGLPRKDDMIIMIIRDPPPATAGYCPHEYELRM